MLSKTFIQELRTFSKPLFYNTKGSKEAYQLNIKHLSFASNMGLAFKVGEYIYPKEALYIVDLENEKIEKIEDKIKLVALESL
jgi:hypothetical protein